MTEMPSCLLSHSDAAYVLGALSPTERLEFERHLPTCSGCRRSVAQLAGMPGLLARVPVEVVEDPEPEVPLPDSVLPHLVGTVRREHRRRRVVLALGAAAAVAVVAAGATAFQAARDDSKAPMVAPAPTTAASLPMTVVHDDGVTADVSLTSVGWGTRVDLTCTYGRGNAGLDDYGTAEGARFTLVIHTTEGRTEQVASWTALPGKTLHMPGATSATVEDIDRVEVRSDAGRPLLRLDL
jgi:hypothetical protein